ncbi:MAG: hypothetical protein ABI686_02990 [Acidobacteriota bacterium]
MKLTKLSFLFSLIVGLLVCASAFAQSQTFNNADVEYTFELPEAAWKMTVTPSRTSPNVEYVYGDRKDGHLEIRKLSLSPNQSLDDLIRDEETKLQFNLGFVAGKEENFKGAMNGKVYNYEFVRSGRNMSGRFYFLQNGDDVYVLRFDGESSKLRSIRNQTDSIARTFSLKKVK